MGKSFSERLKENLKYHFQLFLYYNTLVWCRKAKREILWRKMFGNLTPCMAKGCIFRVEGKCENPVFYARHRLKPKKVFACADGIWRDGSDWSEH